MSDIAFNLYRRAQRFLALPIDESIDPNDYGDGEMTEAERLIAEMAVALSEGGALLTETRYCRACDGDGYIGNRDCGGCKGEGEVLSCSGPTRQFVAEAMLRFARSDAASATESYLVTDDLFHATALTLRSWLPGDLLLGTVERALREALKEHCIQKERDAQ